MKQKEEYRLKQVTDGLFYLYCNNEEFGAIGQVGKAEYLLKIDNYSTFVASFEEGLKVAKKIHPFLDYLNRYGEFTVPKEAIQEETKIPELSELSLADFPNLNEVDPGLGQTLISLQNACFNFLQDLETGDSQNYLIYIAQLKDGMRLLGQTLTQFEKELWRSAYDG